MFMFMAMGMEALIEHSHTSDRRVNTNIFINRIKPTIYGIALKMINLTYMLTLTRVTWFLSACVCAHACSN